MPLPSSLAAARRTRSLRWLRRRRAQNLRARSGQCLRAHRTIRRSARWSTLQRQQNGARPVRLATITRGAAKVSSALTCASLATTGDLPAMPHPREPLRRRNHNRYSLVKSVESGDRYGTGGLGSPKDRFWVLHQGGLTTREIGGGHGESCKACRTHDTRDMFDTRDNDKIARSR